MKTKIKSIHEEKYSDNSRTLGILYNFSIESDNQNWKDSLIYIYRDNMYIFFNTMVDMIDYLLYGESKMPRAYLSEEEFDLYYDAEFIDGSFTEKIRWV